VHRFAALLFLLAIAGSPAEANMVQRGVPPSSGGGPCTQSTNFLARTSGEATATQNNIQAMLCGMATDLLIDGLLSGANSCGSHFDRMFIFFLDNKTDALLDVCGSGTGSGSADGSFTVTSGNNPDPTFTANAGFTGVDASSYGVGIFISSGLRLGINSTNYTLNAAHVSAYMATNPISTASGGGVLGYYDTSSSGILTEIFPRYSSGVFAAAVNSQTGAGLSVASAGTPGMYLAVRSNSTTLLMYQPGQGIVSGSPNSGTDAVSTLGSMDNPIFILGRDVGSGSSDAGSGAQVAFVTMGGPLTNAQVTALYNRVCTAAHAINPTVFPSC
jgi:hypothetical protein